MNTVNYRLNVDIPVVAEPDVLVVGGGPGGRMGMGGMSASNVPSGAVTFSSTLSAGTHTFTYGSTSESFTLKNRVTAGWIWASGITSSNYSLK